MTYVTIKYIKGNPYLYEVRSVREGDRVRQVFVRYLGRADKGERIERQPVARREEPVVEPERVVTEVAPVEAIEKEKIRDEAELAQLEIARRELETEKIEPIPIAEVVTEEIKPSAEEPVREVKPPEAVSEAVPEATIHLDPKKLDEAYKWIKSVETGRGIGVLGSWAGFRHAVYNREVLKITPEELGEIPQSQREMPPRDWSIPPEYMVASFRIGGRTKAQAVKEVETRYIPALQKELTKPPAVEAVPEVTETEAEQLARETGVPIGGLQETEELLEGLRGETGQRLLVTGTTQAELQKMILDVENNIRRLRGRPEITPKPPAVEAVTPTEEPEVEPTPQAVTPEVTITLDPKKLDSAYIWLKANIRGAGSWGGLRQRVYDYEVKGLSVAEVSKIPSSQREIPPSNWNVLPEYAVAYFRIQGGATKAEAIKRVGTDYLPTLQKAAIPKAEAGMPVAPAEEVGELIAKNIERKISSQTGKDTDYITEYRLVKAPEDAPAEWMGNQWGIERILTVGGEERARDLLETGSTPEQTVKSLPWESSYKSAEKYGIAKQIYGKKMAERKAEEYKKEQEQKTELEDSARFQDIYKPLRSSKGAKPTTIQMSQFEVDKPAIRISKEGYDVGRGIGVVIHGEGKYKTYTVTHLNTGLAMGHEWKDRLKAIALAKAEARIDDWSKYETEKDVPKETMETASALVRAFTSETMDAELASKLEEV